jgi:type III secretion system YscI/HrpB-like protein
MDLASIQQAVQAIAEKTQDQAKPGGLEKGAPGSEDIEKLKQALNQPPAEANPANSGVQAQAAEKVSAVGGVEQTNPGSKILESMNNMRSGMQETVNELQQTMASGDLASPADLLKVQMKFQQLTMQTELTSKVVSKSEQNIDTLMKGQ